MRKGSRHSTKTKKKISDALRGRGARYRLKPTPVFKRVYGNYCGRGNRGGKPVDAIDAECRRHDVCYDRGGNAVDCDKKFTDRLDKLDGSGMTRKQRVARHMIKNYFRARGRMRGIR